LTQIAIIIPLVIVVIAAGIIGAVFVILPPALSIAGNATLTSGNTLQLHGSNFIPGGSITFTLDGEQPVQLASSGKTIAISAVGSFDATIAGTEDWSVGAHTLRAMENIGSRSAALSFTITPNHTKVVTTASNFTIPKDAHCAYDANQGWTCKTTLSTSGNAQGKIKWSASSTGITGITITPSSGTLLPDQAIPVTIAIPNMICPASANFTFAFKGGPDPVNLKWSCAVPSLTFPATSCPISNGNYVCTYSLSLVPGSEGMLSWTTSASTNLTAVTFNPASGTMSVGQTTKVAVSLPMSNCQAKQGYFYFNEKGGVPISSHWTCG
jgi:hypothetical protein